MVEKEPENSDENPYAMSLSLNVLNHLGLNLYSNVPAVLSEAVANAWDADAENVDIEIEPQKERIAITDDGHGMNRSDVNERYLHVGYRRRDDDKRPNKTPKHGRPVMGRKGIGKLSLFSIAKTVEVYTVKNGDQNAFRMVVEEIREAIEQEEGPSDEDTTGGTYFPDPIEDEFPAELEEGTKIVLTNLKKQTYQAESALRKRLARRFSIIGSEHNFHVTVNGEPIKVTDRDYFHKVQFLWTFDDHEEHAEKCRNLEQHKKLDNETPNGNTVSGWIGTVEEPQDLVESHPGLDQKDDLNKVSLMVRGKLAQEDLLDDTNDGRLYTKYVVGEIHANFLDVDTKDDIATSSREKIVKDDPRYQDLQEFVQSALDEIANSWTDLRNEQGSEEARKMTAVDEWYKQLNEDQRKKAKKLLGKINQITTDSDDEKRELFKYGVLAFENLRYKDALTRLDELSPDDLEALSEAFVDLDDIEATLYHQIVSQRLEIVEEMQEKVEQNALEKVLQKHLYEHPWLLDPSWERATEDDYMETQIRSAFDEVDADLTDKEKRGRVDIKYVKTSGQHVIAELKRPDRRVDTYELLPQIDKYRSALKKILRKAGRGGESVEVVIILGEEPKDWDAEGGREESTDMLDAKDARIVFYEELLDDASRAYKQYIQKKKKAGRVSEFIRKIETGEAFESEESKKAEASD